MSVDEVRPCHAVTAGDAGTGRRGRAAGWRGGPAGPGARGGGGRRGRARRSRHGPVCVDGARGDAPRGPTRAGAPWPPRAPACSSPPLCPGRRGSSAAALLHLIARVTCPSAGLSRRPRDRRGWSTCAARAAVLLGITGAPGAGKTTLAAALARRTACRWCRWTASTCADVELVRRGPAGPQGRAGDLRRRGVRRAAAPGARRRGDVVAPMFERDLRAAARRRDRGARRGRAGGDRGQLPAARRAALARRTPRARRGLAPGHRRRESASSGWSPGTSSSARRPTRRGPGWPGSTRPTPTLVEAARDRADLVDRPHGPWRLRAPVRSTRARLREPSWRVTVSSPSAAIAT